MFLYYCPYLPYLGGRAGHGPNVGFGPFCPTRPAARYLPIDIDHRAERDETASEKVTFVLTHTGEGFGGGTEGWGRAARRWCPARHYA